MSSSAYLQANLRRLREERGLTQEELAMRAGLKMATVYQIEAGKRGAVIGGSLDALAAALGVEPAELLAAPGGVARATTTEEALAVLAADYGFRLTKKA